MKFGEVPRRPETRRATVDGLCETAKGVRRGEWVPGCGRVAAVPLPPPGRRAGGCPGGAAARRAPRRRRSVVASPPPNDGGSSIVNASVAATELSLSMCRISTREVLRGTDLPLSVLDLRRYQGRLDPPAGGTPSGFGSAGLWPVTHLHPKHLLETACDDKISAIGFLTFSDGKRQIFHYTSKIPDTAPTGSSLALLYLSCAI